MVTKQVIELDYHEFDALVEKNYGRKFESIADMEWHNYSAWTSSFEVEEIDEFDQESLETWMATGKGGYLTPILLQQMVNNGILQPGNYSIEIFW